MYRSPYREQKLPRHLTIPQFVLRHLDNATEHAELLFPSPFGSRAQCKPLALCDVRSGAYALAARLASADLPGGALARGDAVLFLTENQHDYLMMCLGVMLAGGIPALLNPQYRGEELRAIVQKVCPRLVFASEATYQEAEKALAGERSGHGPRVYVFEEHHAQSLHTHLLAPGRQVRGFCEVPVNPVEDTAMYCFSSGTSGTPKIVCLSHFNLVANVIQTVATLGGRMNVPRFDDAHWYDQPLLPPQNGTNQFHLSILPQFHCYGMLMAVASLHTATPSVIFARFHVDQFFEAVQQFRVTFAFVVPPILLALATSPLASRYDLSSVQSFASGAATLSKELCQMVYEKKGIPVTDGYGMTEMSPLIALQTTADIARRHLDVGRLVPNTEARVVDVNTGQDVHPGERGELWLRGPQMMLGYRNNDEANAQAFVPSSHAPDRFFKSGDIVSISNEGRLLH